MNVIEREDYLRGFEFATLYTKGEVKGTLSLARLMFEKRTLVPAWSAPFTDGFVDGIISAIGVDGVCSPDCTCRAHHGILSTTFRRFFHSEDHAIRDARMAGVWLPPNDKQANGRFNR